MAAGIAPGGLGGFQGGPRSPKEGRRKAPRWPQEGPMRSPRGDHVFGHSRVEAIGTYVCSPLINHLSSLQASRFSPLAPLSSLLAPFPIAPPRSSLLAPRTSRATTAATNHATADMRNAMFVPQ
eukprot:979203-Pyramimonas_sp.AAC.1